MTVLVSDSHTKILPNPAAVSFEQVMEAKVMIFYFYF